MIPATRFRLRQRRELAACDWQSWAFAALFALSALSIPLALSQAPDAWERVQHAEQECCE